MASLGGAVNWLQGAYHQAVPGDNRTFATNSAAASKYDQKPATKTVSTPGYTPSNTAKVDTSAIDKQIADSNAAIKALQAQLAAQPKLPFYNTADAWARAQSTAESKVNPVYVDKLNRYLEKAALQRTQTTEQTNFNKSSIDTSLGQTLEDIGTNRTRTGEDAATTQADLAASEAYDQQTGGTQFDRARTALLGDIANSGLTTSGIGRQQEGQAVSDRNTTEKEQTRQYDVQQKAAETLKTRTFEDLDKSETRSKGEAESKKGREDVNLKNFIDNQALEEKDTRVQNELDRLAAVAGETNNQYSVGVANFIAALQGNGARAQDIALAQQVYG